MGVLDNSVCCYCLCLFFCVITVYGVRRPGVGIGYISRWINSAGVKRCRETGLLVALELCPVLGMPGGSGFRSWLQKNGVQVFVWVPRDPRSNDLVGGNPATMTTTKRRFSSVLSLLFRCRCLPYCLGARVRR